MSLAPTRISLARLPTGRLHDVLAESGPGPAGGSAAALATAMASGLVRLVARVSHDWEDAPGVAAQAAALGEPNGGGHVPTLVRAEGDQVALALSVPAEIELEDVMPLVQPRHEGRQLRQPMGVGELLY